MLEKFKQWLNPPDNPGEYTTQDERMLEHDNQQYAANIETEKRLKEMPRTRWSFWFFFF
ncbi:hypothetical protein HF289_13275 [Acidithiobacillus ferrooxidans]|uniref:hypothetical protein n=1 Tax=Acidithiobacillus ferrooxidans TaxID=920 RepID=UPI001C068121|nr:hypothetical protein [Acidithiobacillus ferrooxidans]MBU2857801.1 hypothetical protein [Acidithiobacillus ferrooxidans]